MNRTGPIPEQLLAPGPPHGSRDNEPSLEGHISSHIVAALARDHHVRTCMTLPVINAIEGLAQSLLPTIRAWRCDARDYESEIDVVLAAPLPIRLSSIVEDRLRNVPATEVSSLLAKCILVPRVPLACDLVSTLPLHANP